MITKRAIFALALFAGVSVPLAATNEAGFVGPMNEEFSLNAVGTTAQTRGEVARCLSYWQLWAEEYAAAVPAQYRSDVVEGLGPEATAKAVAWHEAKADEVFDASDFEMLERRVRDLRNAKATGAELLAKWKADPTQAEFFGWLGSCGTR